jgi:hypothetical protein
VDPVGLGRAEIGDSDIKVETFAELVSHGFSDYDGHTLFLIIGSAYPHKWEQTKTDPSSIVTK